MKPLVITIDGPSGAGKGTVARAIAAQLGYRHIDSGAMYRAVGWKAIRDGVPLEDEVAVRVLKLVDALEDLDDVQNVWANFDVSDEVLAGIG